MKNFTFKLFLLFFLSSATFASEKGLFVDVKWLNENIHNKRVQIVDVRPNKDYLQGHIPNAINIPVSKTYNPGKNTDRIASLIHLKKTIWRVRNKA